MAWKKTEDEKAAEALEKQRAAYLATPVGQAELAKQRGDAFFQFEHDVATLSGAYGFGLNAGTMKPSGRSDILGQIEAAGWRLENVGYVFVETSSVTKERAFSGGQGTVTRGSVHGIYLFRNTDA